MADPMTSDALRSSLVPLSSLRQDPKNARVHPARNLEAIKRSLAHFGQQKPIVVGEDGTVIAGNGTLAAASALGWTEIAVVRSALDGSNRTAFAIADNRTAELAEWDDAALSDLLAELQDDEMDLSVTGFDEKEIEELLGSFDGQTDPDDVPETPAVPKTQPGDLIVLGAHTLLCGDSTKDADVARVLDGAAPRLLLTDPPYGVALDMEWRDRAALNGLGRAEASYMRRGEGHTNTSISGDTKADWSDAFELVPSLDTAYVWHASAFAIEVGLGLRRIGFELKQQIIWLKPHFALSRSHYHWQHEPCWYARKPGAAKFRGSRDQSTIWEAASPKMLMNPAGEREEKVDHPTQKPAALFTRPIENHLEKGEAFFEPFCGSGTAIIAAEQTRRRCLAIELDPKYCDVIVARWQNFTGKKAEGWRGND